MVYKRDAIPLFRYNNERTVGTSYLISFDLTRVRPIMGLFVYSSQIIYNLIFVPAHSTRFLTVIPGLNMIGNGLDDGKGTVRLRNGLPMS